MLQYALIAGGLVSSLVYVAINVIVPLAWDQYSVTNQTVSELSAIGAPTRGLWLAAVTPYLILFAAFGLGILRSAGTNRWLRITGSLILLYCAFNIYWPPMHQRAALAAGGASLTDTLHLLWAAVAVALFLLIMGSAAMASGPKFRAYTLVSGAALTVCGLLTSLAAPNVAANLPTPWIGIWERLNIGVFLLWVAILSVSLLRRQQNAK